MTEISLRAWEDIKAEEDAHEADWQAYLEICKKEHLPIRKELRKKVKK